MYGGRPGRSVVINTDVNTITEYDPGYTQSKTERRQLAGYRKEVWASLSEGDPDVTNNELRFIDYRLANGTFKYREERLKKVCREVLAAREARTILPLMPLVDRARREPKVQRLRQRDALQVRVGTWNSCSLEPTRDPFSKTGALLASSDSNSIDVIGITEIWHVSDAVAGTFAEAGFTFHKQERTTSEVIRGGVAFAVRSNYQVISTEKIDIGDFGEAMSIQLKTPLGPVITGVCAYVIPPEAATPRDVMAKLFIGDFLVGDFNAQGPWCPKYSTANGHAAARGRLIHQLASATGFIVANHKGPQQATTVRGTGIDLILHSRNAASSELTLDRGVASDHFFAYCDISFGNFLHLPKLRQPDIDFANITEEQEAKFNEAVKKELKKLPVRTPSSSTHKFLVNCVRNTARGIFPMTRGGGRVKGWSPDVTQLTHESNELWQKYFDLPPEAAEPVRTAHMDRAKEASSKVLAEAGRQFHARLTKMDTHKAYRVFSGESEQRVSPALRSAAGGGLMTDSEMAEKFNAVYTAKSPQQPDNAPPVPPEPPPDPLQVPAVTMEEVKTAIFDHNIKGCRDPDGLSVRLLRKLPDEYFNFLAEVFTESLRQSKTPQQWRQCTNSPLHKGNHKDVQDPANFRPVAMTSLISRTWERVLERRLIHQVEDKLSEHQFGYRQGKSATHIAVAIQRFMREGVEATTKLNATQDKNRPTRNHKGLLLQLDSSDAFCCIPHKTILAQLRRWNVPDYMVSAIESWLNNRRHRTKVGTAVSDWANLTSGVPQGSVLGPLLYIIGTDSLLDVLSKKQSSTVAARAAKAAMAAFADDVGLWAQGVDPTRMADGLRLWANHGLAWLGENQIKVSKKSELHMFDNAKRAASDVTVKLKLSDDATMDLTSTHEPARVLGPIIDATTLCTSHLSALALDFETVVCRMESLRMILHPSQLREIYFAYAMSKLSYAAPVLWDWSGKNLSYQQTLEDLHVRAARAICGTAATASRLACLCEAGLEPLHVMLHGLAKRVEAKMARGGQLARRHCGSNTNVTMQPLLTRLPYDSIPEATIQSRAIHFYLDIGTLPGKDELVNAKSSDEDRLADNQRRIRQAKLDHGEPVLAVYTDASVVHEGCEPGSARAAAAYLIFQGDDPAAAPIASGAVPAGTNACSFSAETIALYEALDALDAIQDQLAPGPVIWPTDSRSALEALAKGVLRQDDWVMAEIWKKLLKLSALGWTFSFVFVFSHCGLAGNDAADDKCGSFVNGLKDPTPHRLGAWWKDGARSVDSVYRDKHWHIGTPTHCAIRDFHRGTRKEKVPAKWAAKSVRLTAQLRTGVCGSLGGISEEGIECYWCKTPDHDGKHELRRGGSAVNHLFRCPHPTVVSKRDELLVPLLRREESVVTAAFLWEHPGAALRYAEFFFSGRAATPDDDADVENNTQVNEPLL